MSTAGIPFTTLTRQALALGTGFGARYPHAWLVWEPGARVTPTPQDPDVVSTAVPLQSPTRGPVQGDPFCFPLVAKTPGAPVHVGRAPECDLVLDDLTVSRAHFDLRLDGDDWYVTVPEASHATTLVRNMSLQPGEKMKLVDGCTIVAGGVTLTFSQKGKLYFRLVASGRTNTAL